MNFETLEKELRFKMSRSSGKGGQHINKVSSRVSLFFDIANTECFDQDQKDQLLKYFASRISKDGILQISCQKTRSQFKNKQTTIQQFFVLIDQALQVKKERKKRQLPKSVKLKRQQQKRFQSEKKKQRKKFKRSQSYELFPV